MIKNYVRCTDIVGLYQDVFVLKHEIIYSVVCITILNV